MLKRYLRILVAGFSLLSGGLAQAGTTTIGVTVGSGLNYQVITNGGGAYVGIAAIADGTAAANIAAVKAASTAAGTTDPALVVAISPNNSVAITAASLPLPTGASTAAGLTTINTTLGSPFQAGGSIGNTTFASTQSGTWTVNPTTAANWGVGTSTQNSATVANGQLGLAQFNTTPTTITTGNMSPLQMDSAGNLLVNIKAGAGSGGTAIADNAAFTTGTTNETPIGCYAGTPTATANHSTVVSCSTGGVINVSVTNANANGQATMANSSPVTLASNQAVADVCTFAAKTTKPFATSGATNVQVVAPSGSTKVYICGMSIIAGAAAHFNVIEGTGGSCTTANELAVIGSTTAGNGASLAANGGWTIGDGNGTIAQTATAANGICILTDSSIQFAGHMQVVQQ